VSTEVSAREKYSLERVVRVFVSSTFRDMGAERNELVTRTFQRLRKLCDSLGIVWSEVDLRWGITDEQRVNEEVLPICLARIDACRPYFIGILGERYGWVCESFSHELVERYAWIAGLDGRSITDLEFQHGALRYPALARRAFFYFRVHPINEESKTRADNQISPGDDASQKFEVQPAKLERLKEQVRTSGLPLREGYNDGKELGELVFHDLERAIHEDFPETNIDHAGFAARRAQKIYARARTRIYLARPSDFQCLDDHAASGNMPLVITGPSGIGKSALLANWALKCRQSEARPFLEFYVGASPESSDWRQLVAYSLGQLGLTGEMSASDPEILRISLARGLQRVAAADGCILMLDALNQLEDREGALQLAWLPIVIPPKVCLILSTLEGPVLEECRRRGWTEWSVPALCDLEFFLEVWRSNELDVKRYWANLEQLAGRDRLAAYKAVLADPVGFQRVADDIGTLLEEAGFWQATLPIYEGLAREFERSGERLQEARALLRKARILDALGRRAEAVAAHERAELLFRELNDQEGLMISLGEQAQIRISQGETDLALRLLKEAERLAVERTDDNSLQAILVSRAAILTDRYALNEAGALLERAEKICIKLGDADGLQRVYGYQIEWLIFQRRRAEALRRSEEKERICLELGDRSGRAGALSDRAVILADMNQLDTALGLLDDAETLFRQIGSKSGLATIAGNRASLLIRSHRPEEALDLLKEQERLYGELEERLELDVCLYNQARVYQSLEDPERATALFDLAAEAARAVERHGAQAIAWVGKARLLSAQNDCVAAYDLLKRALGTFRKLKDLRNEALTFRSMADVLSRTDRLEAAMALAKKAEAIGEQLRSPIDVANALECQCEILEKADQSEDALTIREREVIVRKSCSDDDGVVTALNAIVRIAHKLGKTDKLLEALNAQFEPICRLGRQSEMHGQLEKAIGSMRSRENLGPEEFNYLDGLEKILSRFP
jgi:tetratricopeptide (TPR) repeat protein